MHMGRMHISIISIAKRIFAIVLFLSEEFLIS